MNSQQKTALTSVVAALGLIALKVTTGLITGSLAFLSGALDSGLDLVTALMTLLAIGLVAAARLAFKNADILIDRSPRSATETVRQAIDGLDPPVDLKQLRVRE